MNVVQFWYGPLQVLRKKEASVKTITKVTFLKHNGVEVHCYLSQMQTTSLAFVAEQSIESDISVRRPLSAIRNAT